MISSLAGQNAIAGMAAYCASKAALDHLAACLMLEVRHQGVKVTRLAPGSVDTGFGGHAPRGRCLVDAPARRRGARWPSTCSGAATTPTLEPGRDAAGPAAEALRDRPPTWRASPAASPGGAWSGSSGPQRPDRGGRGRLLPAALAAAPAGLPHLAGIRSRGRSMRPTAAPMFLLQGVRRPYRPGAPLDTLRSSPSGPASFRPPRLVILAWTSKRVFASLLSALEVVFGLPAGAS